MKYATRQNVHVDRQASAWLIKRFIDKDATFIFVTDESVPEEARAYDMTGVEWGHQGDKCTFEVLMELHCLTDPVLLQIAAIIHGADIVEDFDTTLESPGIDLAFRGIRLVSESDEQALERGSLLMDALYAAIKNGYRR